VITSVNEAFTRVSSEHIIGDFVLLSSFCSFLMTVYLALGLVASELTALLLKSQVLLERKRTINKIKGARYTRRGKG
jgi:hypothetical protein